MLYPLSYEGVCGYGAWSGPLSASGSLRQRRVRSRFGAHTAQGLGRHNTVPCDDAERRAAARLIFYASMLIESMMVCSSVRSSAVAPSRYWVTRT